jgi:hypothetical protein
MTENQQLPQKRLGVELTCDNCVFLARYRASKDQITPSLICAWGPPPVILIQNPQGVMEVMSVTRPLPQGRFCFQYRPVPNMQGEGAPNG